LTLADRLLLQPSQTIKSATVNPYLKVPSHHGSHNNYTTIHHQCDDDPATISTRIDKPPPVLPNNISDYAAFKPRRPKGRTIEQEIALKAKHQERQERRQANAEKANGKRTFQCNLPVSGTCKELAAAMNIKPTEVVPAAKDNTVENIPHGDSSLEPKAPNLSQFVLNNVHGISAQHNYAKAKELGEGMLQHQADFGAFTETQRNFSIKELRNRIHGKFRPYFKQSRMVTSSAEPIPKLRDQEYLPGGSCTIVGDDLVGRICATKTDDKLGRWSCVTLKGKHNRHLTVINAYQVCKDSLAGTTTQSAWKQQWRVLRKHITNPDPRK
jgi:hypothetical protein